jgi:hypothetical protein
LNVNSEDDFIINFELPWGMEEITHETEKDPGTGGWV